MRRQFKGRARNVVSPRAARRARRGLWRGRIGAGVAVLALGFAVLPPVVDAVNGFVKASDGCRVVGVIDGDTVRLLCPVSGLMAGRVLAYDTPEKRAACLSEWVKATRATWMLRRILWTGREISARTEGRDRYGRALTVLIVDGEGVARQMVEAGLARWYDGGLRGGWCAGAGA